MKFNDHWIIILAALICLTGLILSADFDSIRAITPNQIKSVDSVYIDANGNTVAFTFHDGISTCYGVVSGGITCRRIQGCDPSYPEFCIPINKDINCDGVNGQRNFIVFPPDPYGLDGDNDGIGCEQ